MTTQAVPWPMSTAAGSQTPLLDLWSWHKRKTYQTEFMTGPAQPAQNAAMSHY